HRRGGRGAPPPAPAPGVLAPDGPGRLTELLLVGEERQEDGQLAVDAGRDDVVGLRADRLPVVPHVLQGQVLLEEPGALGDEDAGDPATADAVDLAGHRALL